MNTWDQDGPSEDSTYPGIYEFDGDTLRVCFARLGGVRPTGFSSTQGTGFLYYLYKRQRP